MRSKFSYQLGQVYSVVVEYDCRGERKTKEFPDMLSARRFYVAQYKAGHNPKIVSAAR